MSSPLSPHDPSTDEARSAAPSAVRHRTERDAQGRVWRFVYDPAAQDAIAAAGMVRVRCTTGNARATILVRGDWLEWPRQQLLDELTTALHLQRNGGTAAAPATANGNGTPVTPDRRIARRRLVRDVRGAAWNCVYDPSIPGAPDDGERVRVRCTAGRDRLELVLESSWHRLGDRQLAELIAQALGARGR